MSGDTRILVSRSELQKRSYEGRPVIVGRGPSPSTRSGYHGARIICPCCGKQAAEVVYRPHDPMPGASVWVEAEDVEPYMLSEEEVDE